MTILTNLTLPIALRLARPGAVLEVSGDVKPFWPRVRFPAPGIRIKSVDGGVLSGWNALSDNAGIVFDGFKVIANGSAGIGIGGPATERCALENCDLFAAKGGVGGAGNAAVLLGGVALRKSRIHDADGGLSLQRGIEFEIEDCVFENLSSDGINMAPGEGAWVRIARTVIRNSVAAQAVHLDGIQMHWTNAHYMITVEDCEVDSRIGTPMQGIFGGNESVKVILRRNALRGVAWQGIGISNCAPGSIIEDNFVQGSTRPYNGQVMTPWILVNNPVTGVVVRRNWTTGMRLDKAGVKAEDTHWLKNVGPGKDADYLAWKAQLPPASSR